MVFRAGLNGCSQEPNEQVCFDTPLIPCVQRSQRRGAFIEEVEAEERKKALLASSGPMTLTSLMAKRKKEGKSGLVYVNVGSLESEDVFVSEAQGGGAVSYTHLTLPTRRTV